MVTSGKPSTPSILSTLSPLRVLLKCPTLSTRRPLRITFSRLSPKVSIRSPLILISLFPLISL